MAAIPLHIFSDASALNRYFDPDAFDAPVLGVAANYDAPDANTPRAGFHAHNKGQLTFTRQGSTGVELQTQFCMVPPHWAVWIPAGTFHKTVQRNSVQFRSLYLDQNRFPELPAQPQVIAVSPLLRELAERVAFAEFETDWTQSRHRNLVRVLIDEICDAPRKPMSLPLPRDPRLKPLLEMLRQDQLPPQLQDIAPSIGASKRTICRIFFRETGMSYRLWRQQWRLIRSIDLMSNMATISAISNILEFNSDSAFVAFFKQYTGTTPGCYMREFRCSGT